jgi:hypothetical protein
MEEGKERVKEEEIKVVRVSLSFSQNPSVRFPSSSHSSYLSVSLTFKLSLLPTIISYLETRMEKARERARGRKEKRAGRKKDE